MGQKKLGLTACRLKALSVGQGWELISLLSLFWTQGKTEWGGGSINVH